MVLTSYGLQVFFDSWFCVVEFSLSCDSINITKQIMFKYPFFFFKNSLFSSLLNSVMIHISYSCPLLIGSLVFVCAELSSILVLDYTEAASSCGCNLSPLSLGKAQVLCGKILLLGAGSAARARSTHQ